MMIPTEFRMMFDGTSATSGQLDRIERITVDQEIDAAREARIEIAICTNEKGEWIGQDEDFMRGFARVRVEVSVGDAGLVALIDGPVVGDDVRLDARPGGSSLILIVHDDSVYLNREEGVERFENLTDSEIAQQVFGQYAEIAETRIDETPSPSGARPLEVVRRGTHMDLLRELADRNAMHAYVLPGSQAGASVGVFQESPIEPDGLPDLVLLGNDRNLESFEIRRNEQGPSRVLASVLSLSDKTVTAREAKHGDVVLLGDEPAFKDAAAASVRRLPPGQNESVDLAHRVLAEARRLSYGFEASATVRSSCYGGVIEPYRVVTVRGVDGKHNGDYLITQVTHTLDRHQYTQSLRLIRNAQTATSYDASIPTEIF